MRFLIERGANPNDRLCGEFAGTTLLIVAAQSGSLAILEEILRYHPDIHAKDNSRDSALAAYVKTGAESDIEKGFSLLLANGADVNSRDGNGGTPLFGACKSGSAEAVRLLAKAGADLNARDQNGQTALMSCFDYRALKTLIEAGADVAIRDSSGRTASEVARPLNLPDNVGLLNRAANPK